MLNETVFAIHLLGQFFERADVSHIVYDVEGASAQLRAQAAKNGAFVNAVIPHFQISHLGVPKDALAIKAYTFTYCPFALCSVRAETLRRHCCAGRQPL